MPARPSGHPGRNSLHRRLLTSRPPGRSRAIADWGSHVLSVFDVFKIGIGPSSSHTIRPMSAANRFLALVLSDEWPRALPDVPVTALGVSLHGSLPFTGIGHGTARP